MREEKIMHKWATAVHKGWESGEASCQWGETPWLDKSLISFNENVMIYNNDHVLSPPRQRCGRHC